MSRHHTSRGYSFVELLVAMLILGIIMTALVSLFNASSRIAKVQTEVAEVQQSLRVAQDELTRMVRMAGAGGLPARWLDRNPAARIPTYDYTIEGAFPNGFAIEIDSNVPDDTLIPAPATAPDRAWVVPNTDVLTIRGSLTTSVFYTVTPTPVSNRFTMEIPDVIGTRLYPTPVLAARVQEALDAGRPLALMVRDLASPDAYAVMQVDPATTDTTPQACVTGQEIQGRQTGVRCITIGLMHDVASSPGTALAFGLMTLGNNLGSYAGVPTFALPSGAPLPDAPVPQQVSSISILDEFRYFVRAEWEVPNDPTSRLKPVLTRAEFVPGTETMIERVDLVENVINMQVAVGLDADRDGQVLDTGDDQDEILFNDSDDLTTGIAIASAPVTDWWQSMPLAFVRMTLVAQARRPDLRYEAPLLGTVEDADLSATVQIDGESHNFNADRLFRRQIRQWTIDPRNLQ